MKVLERPAAGRLNGVIARSLLTRRVFGRAGLHPTPETLERDWRRLLWTIRYKLAKVLRPLVREKVVIVTQKQRKCGIYQFGLNTCETLARSRKYRFQLVECDGAADFERQLLNEKPTVVIFNYYAHMGWVTPDLLDRVIPPRIFRVGMIHEYNSSFVESAPPWCLDQYIALDPTAPIRSPRLLKVGRCVPHYENRFPVPTIPTIGSFGFGVPTKGFERLVDLVQEEFDEAVIRLQIPYNDTIDPDGSAARAIAARCRDRLHKPGLRLEITHDFLTREGLLDFLAQNSLNAFLYDYQKDRAVSSVIDLALAVDRPIAVTRSEMFRHIHDARPSVCVEDSSLRDILAAGGAPLKSFKERWSEAALVREYDAIVDGLLHRTPPARSLAAGDRVGGFNRTLERERAAEWAVDTVVKFASLYNQPTILCLGDAASTVASALRAGGLSVDLRGHEDPLPTRCYDVTVCADPLGWRDASRTLVRLAGHMASSGTAVVALELEGDWRKQLFDHLLPAITPCELADPPNWRGPVGGPVALGLVFRRFPMRRAR